VLDDILSTASLVSILPSIPRSFANTLLEPVTTTLYTRPMGDLAVLDLERMAFDL
jgi:hypothetical protein